MLLTKREEQLLKALLNYGKLSIDNMGDILKVSRRTVYRVLNELTDSLESLNISIIKEDQKYYLTGELEELRAFSSQDNFSKNERLNLITYYLLIANQEITNEFLQEKLAVSNVTIIQDIAIVEKRLADFNILLKRQKGYQVTDSQKQKRWLLAVLLSNNQSISDFWKLKTGYFDLIPLDRMRAARDTFQKYQSDIPEMDSKLMQFFSILLALSNWQEIESSSHQVSKLALDFSQKVYGEFSKETKSLYSIQEILYFARL
ncbi:TPA: HTH domain-containing protein, partial [Streptococcus pyogenes]